MTSLLFWSEVAEDRVDDPHQDHEDDHRDNGREVEWPERRQDPPEETQVRLADIAQEVLGTTQPGRVREPDPRAQDVDEDQEDVDPDEVVDEAVRRRRCVEEQDRAGAQAHGVAFGLARWLPTRALPKLRRVNAVTTRDYPGAPAKPAHPRRRRRKRRLGLVEEAAALE